MTTWVAALVALLGTLASCVLSALFIALGITARGSVDEIASQRGDAAARKRIERIFGEPIAHAVAAGLFKLFFDLAVVAGFIFWVTQILHPGNPQQVPGIVDVAIGTGIALVDLWVFGVLIPMSLARHAGARLIYSRSIMLRTMQQLTSPLQAAARFIDEMTRRLAGVEHKAPEERAQDEIMSVVEEGATAGAVDDKVRQMIESVMKFPTRTVEEIMTPRTNVQALEYTNNLGAIIQTIKRIGHSRIPVYEETLDRIVGLFYVKDLMKWLAGEGTHGGGKPFELKAILRPPVVVPWSKTVHELLDEMIQKKVHIALVADEYGGTAGLVTIEDIFEEIVGDIKDEYEPGPPETPSVVLLEDQRRAELDAGARIDEVNLAIAPLGVEIPESGDYDTVGGFITTTLGRIPAKGESFTHGRMTFRVLEATPTRIVRAALKVQADEPGAEAPPGVAAHPASTKE